MGLPTKNLSIDGLEYWYKDSCISINNTIKVKINRFLYKLNTPSVPVKSIRFSVTVHY